VFLLSFALFLGFSIYHATALSSAANRPTRAIHVIYDNSGTMIRVSEQGSWLYNDRWGQQRYAIEVLAAMLEDTDVMRIYYLSDFDVLSPVVGHLGNLNAPPRVTIHGSESVAARVSRVRDTITMSANTPFDPVIRAYNDLRESAADEQWLIILSDGTYNQLEGQWNSDIDVNGMLTQFASESNVSIFFIAIGEDEEIDEIVSSLHPNPDIGYFFYHARNSHEILGRITHMSNIIFNRNVLPFTNVARHEFSFDVPMTEIIVFAQGPNVNIGGIRGDATFSPSESVNVRYSEIPAANPHFQNNPNVIISRELTGVVATFRNIPIGSYYLDITGAQTIEVYFQPSVTLDIRLYSDGQPVTPGNILEGDYQVRFGLINEQGDFFEPALLGNITYEATVTNAGRTLSIRSGETISLERGDLAIDVQARFLEINSAENTIRTSVLADAVPLDVEISVPDVDFLLTELERIGPLIVTVRNDGALLTQSQWTNMPLPRISSEDNIQFAGIRHGTDISTFEFYLSPAPGDLGNTATGNVTIDVHAQLMFDEQLREGFANAEVYISIPDISVDIGIDAPDGLTVTHLNDSGTFVVTVRQDGLLLTEAQWQNMPLPIVTSRHNVDIVDIRRGSAVSTFEFNINQRDGDRFATSTGDVVINVLAEPVVNGLAHTGEANTTVNIVNDIGFIERLINWLERYGALAFGILLLLLLILGYLPPIKKYLPKKLVRRPRINKREGWEVLRPTVGKYTKKPWSTLLPYVRQRGTIQFTPKGVMSPLEVRGAGGNRMEITNLRRYAGNKNFLFKDEMIEKDISKQALARLAVTPPSVTLTATRNNTIYECNPIIKN